MNKIYVVGAIDEDSFKQFSEELTAIERKSNPENRFVEIEMNSGGGSAMDALAFYSRIINSPCSINVTSYGLVASAAVLVFAACDHRRMTKDSWMMVHEDSDALKDKSTSDFGKHAAYMRRMEDQWNTLLEKETGTLKSVWLDLHKKTTYLIAEECVKLGIVDEVI